MPIPLGVMIAGGLASVGSSLFNAGRQRRTDRENMERQYQMQREQSKYQHTLDVEMWNKANEYNRPEAQMGRLKTAGLNPNLVYGSGGVDGNTTSQTPKYQAFNPSYNQSAMKVPDILPMLSLYQDMQLKKAQIDNVNSGTSINKTVDLLKQLEHFSLSRPTDTEFTGRDGSSPKPPLAVVLKRYQLEAEKQNLYRLRLENDWREKGITPSDSLPIRVLGRYLEKILKTSNWEKYWKH